MNKKIFFYILIGLGALDLIIWVFNGFSFGWLELIVGVNAISQYGAWIMIATGIWLLRKENAKEKSEIDAISDIETGEEIIFKNSGNTTIITLTSKKIIYRAFNVEENTLKQNDNVIADEKAIIYYTDIINVSAVKVKDVANTKIGKLSGFEFGISLKMKDGSIKNLPTSKSELICAHISKYINN
jgi:hypothetical protein